MKLETIREKGSNTIKKEKERSRNRSMAEGGAAARSWTSLAMRSALRGSASLAVTAALLFTAAFGGGWSGAVFAASPQPAAGYPLVNLTVDESRGTIAAMNADTLHNTKCYGTMELTIPEEMAEAGGYKAQVTAEMEIKGRGNSTWNMQKKPYQIKLTSKENPFGMGKHKTWILLQNHADKTLIRNRLMYDLADKLGLPYTPKSEFVEVCMNGEYLGTYQLCEKTQIGTNRIEIDDLEDEPDAVEEPAITGGYLLEQDRRDRATAEPIWFRAKSGNYFVMKSPETANSAQKAYITDYMNELEEAIMSSDFRNEKGQRYDNLIDLDSLVNYMIVQELAKNYDAGGAGTTSVYMYKPRNDVMYMGPVWDFDLSVGNYHVSGSQNPSNWMIINSGWYAYLQKDRVFMERLQSRWNEIQGILKELYEDAPMSASRITELTDCVRGMNNWDRWTFSEQIVTWSGSPVGKDYDAEVNKLRSFVKNRVAWINANMAAKVAGANSTTAIGGTVAIEGTERGLDAELSELRPAAAIGSLSYEWYRDGTLIEGAAGPKYTPTLQDRGHRITVKATAAGSYKGSLESTAAHELKITVNEAQGSAAGNGFYGVGQEVTVSAEALPGYRFAEWSARGLSFADRWSPQTTVRMPESGNAELQALFEKISEGAYEMSIQIKDSEDLGCDVALPGEKLTLALKAKDVSNSPQGIRMMEGRVEIDTSIFDIGELTPGSDAAVLTKKDGGAPGIAVIQALYYNPKPEGDQTQIELGTAVLTVKQDAVRGAVSLKQQVIGLTDGSGNQPERSQITELQAKVEIMDRKPEGTVIIGQASDEVRKGPHLLSRLAAKPGYGNENSLIQIAGEAGAGQAYLYRDHTGSYPLYYSSVLNAWIGLIPQGDLSYAQLDAGLETEAAQVREIRYGIIGDSRDSRDKIAFEDLYYFDRTALVNGTVPVGDAERVLAMDINGDYFLTPADLVKLIRIWLDN